MELRDVLSERLRSHKTEVRLLRERITYLEGLIGHIQAVVEAEDHRGQLKLGGQEAATPTGEKAEGPRTLWDPKGEVSVRQAVDDMLEHGPTHRKDLVRRIPLEYPVAVKDMQKSVSAALALGTKAGRYERVAKGVYKLK